MEENFLEEKVRDLPQLTELDPRIICYNIF